MNRNNVTPAQARIINRWLTATMFNLNKLHERMTESGFPNDDSLMKKVTVARDAIGLLRTELHEIEGRPQR